MRSSSSSSSKSSGESNKYKRFRKKQSYHHEQNPFLINQIIRAIKDGPQDHHKLFQMKHYTKMVLKVLQRKPVYVSDNSACIIALFKQEQYRKIQLNPNNRLSNDFYAAHSKPHIVFNCFDDAATDEAPEFPSAYHPAFHFSNYQQFKQRRKSVKVLVSCERIQVKLWSVGIVNISGSGYYAPILIIHQYQNMKGENYVLEQPVQNILFYQQIAPLMQQYRITDLRALAKNSKGNQNVSNFSYYMRNQISGQKTTKSSPFVSLDMRGTYLNNEQMHTVYFVPLGSVSQFCLFKRPVNPKLLSNKKNINIYRYEIQQHLPRRQNSQASQSSYESFQFAEDHREYQMSLQNEEQQNINKDNLPPNYDQYEFQDQQEQQSEELDYLRKAYINKMKANNEHII